MTGFEAKTILKNTAFLATVSTYQAIEDAVQTAIDALDKPQRTGKWIFPYGDRKYKKCSACERVYYSIPHDSNYCPNCGCRMTEEKA